MSERRDHDFADALAEAGRKVGQAMDDALDRMQPVFDAVADVANRAEVRTVLERAQQVLSVRPCLCMCSRAHPDDHGICQKLDAVVTGQLGTGFLADLDVPLCAPCAAARAARQFTS
jgi:hypothetical protein